MIQQGVRTAQEIVTKHLPIEWRADARAPEVVVKMAQAVTDAVQENGVAVTGWETLRSGSAPVHQ